MAIEIEVGEATPLLRREKGQQRFSNEISRHRVTFCIPRCLGLCLSLPVGTLLLFRLFVSAKMAKAWREAAVLPANSSQVWMIDPLQGARPEFLLNSSFEGSERVPLVIVHGIEITARDMDHEAELLAHLMPGTYVQSVEYAPGVVTYFTPLDDQLESLCLRLRKHHVFGVAKEVDMLGHSSGALMARAVAQNVRGCFGRDDV